MVLVHYRPFSHDSTLRQAAAEHFASERMMPWSARVSAYQTRVLEEEAYRQECERWNAKVPESLKMHQRVLHLRKYLACAYPEFHGFMFLPRELRDMIYRAAVVDSSQPLVVPLVRPDPSTLLPQKPAVQGEAYNEMGQLYDRYMNYPDSKPLPGMEHISPVIRCIGALSRASKQVHLEAARIFFQENNFIFPAGDWCWPNFLNIGAPPANEFEEQRQELAYGMRNASYTFDMRDVVLSDISNVHGFVEAGTIDRLRPPPRREFLELLHDNREEALHHKWAERITSIKVMSGLEKLSIGLDECYCGFGCCRQVEWVMHMFISGIPEDPSEPEWEGEFRAPKCVQITGWRDKEERDMILERLAVFKPFGMVDVEFRGVSLQYKQEEWETAWDGNQWAG
ncbi:hypothetical protein E8E14_001321 [Neopestalotiopsis sp. 37M]|nr:hypothetical protein E8E14_001321 [Neopestalotiopsis sp. 37M]